MEQISLMLFFHSLENLVFSLRGFWSPKVKMLLLCREMLAQWHVCFNQKLTRWLKIQIQSPKRANERSTPECDSGIVHSVSHGESFWLGSGQCQSKGSHTSKQASSPWVGWGEAGQKWWENRNIMNKTWKYYSKPWITNSGPAHQIQSRSVKFT